MLEYLKDYHLEPNLGIRGQLSKVMEEFEEVKEAFGENRNNSHRAQEILDLILSSVNLLRKMERDDLILISEEVEMHKNKLNFYLEEGKYDNK
ncbi:MAG: hypothetical protein ACRC6U_09340 [Fusobacteriaceae bacterium]